MKSLRNYQGWGIRVLVIMVATLWLALVAASWADAAESKDDGYNFDWLDPEKKIYVLQNRRYTKANRMLLSVMGGTGFSNPYRNAYHIEPRLAYYVTEQWGFEVFYTLTMNSENGVFEALQRAVGSSALPVIREVRSQMGLMAHWSPWYAKINVFNKILYFDWYFAGGIGQMMLARDNRTPANATNGVYADETYFAPMIGTGHQYHLSDSLSVRLDFTGSFYNALTGTTVEEKAWFPNYNFGIGLGVRL